MTDDADDDWPEVESAGLKKARKAAREVEAGFFWEGPRWPRRLNMLELDAYGHGFHDGWRAGFECGRADE